MKNFKLIVALFLISCTQKAISQNTTMYSTYNAHSHNDYENPIPFFTAYENNFGSIESDIFYFNDSLFVGHVFGDIAKKRTLQSLYLDPLNNKIKINNGFPYMDSTRTLQLLIDIKTDPERTIGKLVNLLNTYPAIIQY